MQRKKGRSEPWTAYISRSEPAKPAQPQRVEEYVFRVVSSGCNPKDDNPARNWYALTGNIVE